ncbi:ABC transporter ATP-binding protein [Vulgatibacter incomptus]|nr:ABC transporter ATP-binding protein [Vulgatibacter incomptus]
MGKAYDGRMLRRLWPYIRPHRKVLALSLAALLVQTGLQLFQPLLMGDVVNRAAEKDASGLLRNGVVLAALLVVIQLLTFLQTYTMQLAGARAMADLRASVFDFYQRLTLRYFDRTPIGRLVTRSTNDVDAVGEMFSSGVLNAVGDLVSLVAIVAMMLVLDWRLSLITFASLPVVGVIVDFVRRRSRAAYREIRAKTARLNAFLGEQVTGIAVVQAFAREEAMAAELDGINVPYRDANKRAVYYEAVLDAAIEMVSTLCLASILWWAGFHRLGANAVDFALIVTFTQYVRQFFQPVSLLSNRYTVLQSAMSGAERVFGLLDETDVLAPEPADAVAAEGDLSGEAVALEDVSFEYKPGVPVLRGVSLSARRGEKLALVGATGAGKTTVASLLLRLYEAGSGTVRVLGRDVRSYSPQELRRLFSVVPQDVFLFSGTVLSNIAMTDAEPDREKAERALARIGALELFLSREGGLDARVDERGANFSAGECQLLAFARAVYRDAPLLILDEATASIDSDTEARLQVALDAVMEGRTSIVIAHRLSTIRAADRIAVFHKGKVVEVGRHEELLARGGTYAALYRLQFSQEERQEAPAKAAG